MKLEDRLIFVALLQALGLTPQQIQTMANMVSIYTEQNNRNNIVLRNRGVQIEDIQDAEEVKKIDKIPEKTKEIKIFSAEL